MTGTMIAAAPKVPMLSACCGLPPSFVRTKKVPRIDTMMPAPAMTSGTNTNS